MFLDFTNNDTMRSVAEIFESAKQGGAEANAESAAL